MIYKRRVRRAVCTVFQDREKKWKRVFLLFRILLSTAYFSLAHLIIITFDRRMHWPHGKYCTSRSTSFQRLVSIWKISTTYYVISVSRDRAIMLKWRWNGFESDKFFKKSIMARTSRVKCCISRINNTFNTLIMLFIILKKC